MKHRTIREQDELTCTCGLRWGVNDHDPHEPATRPVGGGKTKSTRTGYVEWPFSEPYDSLNGYTPRRRR